MASPAMQSRALVLLLVACLCAISVRADDADYVVRMVQVAHRHGARNPFVPENKTEICGSPDACGLLTDVGIEMILAIGVYMRERYNDPAIVGEPFFPSEIYNASLLYTRSTSTERSLQSAVAFLQGIFPNLTHFYPAIYSFNYTTDVIGVTDAVPEIMIKRYVDNEGTELALQPVIDAHFTWDEIRAMAEDAFLSGYCNDYNKRFGCAFKLYDILDSFRASGRLVKNSALARGEPGLTALWTGWKRYIFGWNPKNPVNATQGSAGQFLALDMIKNIRSHISNPRYKMYHYSGHDTTVTPLGISFGDQGDATMTPQYGVTMQVELLEKKSDGSFHVRVLRGNPERNETTGRYQFVPEVFAQKCRTVDGEVYTPADGICPYEDVARYIDFTSANKPNGYCYLPPKQYAMLNCTRTRSRSTPLPYYCKLYRTICPSSACAEGYVLSMDDLSCYPIARRPARLYDVVLAQVVHRHGARAPNVKYNQSLICGTEYPCGTLNGVGMKMMQSVGVYMRQRYNDDAIVGEPFFPSETYNSSVVYTRSTGKQRTIQSATSFLHGLFPDAANFFPVVFSANMTVDFLLSTDPMPPVMLKRLLSSPEWEAVLDPVTDKYFTFAELQAAAEEGFIGGACSDYKRRSQCALDVFDVGTSFEAVGKLDDKPKLKAALPGAIAVNVRSYEYATGFDPRDELQRKQGTMAQNLAQEILGNIRAHMLSPSYKLFEYSTHDSMVTPLGVTFGDQGYDTMLPPYGVTYQVELLKDVGDGSFHVRVLRGNPEKQANGEYKFQQTGFPQRCKSANGDVYVAVDNVCPLDDFVRLVDSTRPQGEYGFCNVNPAYYANMNCPETIADSKPVPHYCQIYRIACPTMSCPAKHVLGSDLQCYPATATSQAQMKSTTAPLMLTE